MKTNTSLTKESVQEAINKAEANGPLGSRNQLYQAAAAIYNEGKTEGTISHTVVYLRVKEWNLTVKTPAGVRNGEKSAETLAKMQAGRAAAKAAGTSKKGESADNKEHFDRLLKITPQNYQKLIAGAQRGSRKAAMKLMCLQCMGFERAHVNGCQGISCPLYSFRPYQKDNEPDVEESDVVATEPVAAV